MTRTIARLLTLAIIVLAAAPAAAASSGADDARHRRIRTHDPRMQQLIDEGVLRSATLRALVERLLRSDVVVYVVCDGDPPARIAGRLTFVTAAGGLRYVVVRLTPLRSRAHEIAVLGHELRHAVEVADTPAIVDTESMAREYMRFGRVNPHASTPGVAFDTQAAIEAGQQVLGELGD